MPVCVDRVWKASSALLLLRPHLPSSNPLSRALNRACWRTRSFVPCAVCRVPCAVCRVPCAVSLPHPRYRLYTRTALGRWHFQRQVRDAGPAPHREAYVKLLPGGVEVESVAYSSDNYSYIITASKPHTITSRGLGFSNRLYS